MDESDIIEWQKGIITKLEIQLKAEQNYNYRLIVAVSHYKEVAGIARNVAATAWVNAGRDSADGAMYDTARNEIVKLVDKADTLLLPIAENVK